MQNYIKATTLLPHRLQSSLFWEWQKRWSLFLSECRGPPYLEFSPHVSEGSPKSSVCWPSTQLCVADRFFRRCVCGFACRKLHPGCWRGCWAEQLRAELSLALSQQHCSLWLYRRSLHGAGIVAPSKWPGALKRGGEEWTNTAQTVEAGARLGDKWKKSHSLGLLKYFTSKVWPVMKMGLMGLLLIFCNFCQMNESISWQGYPGCPCSVWPAWSSPVSTPIVFICTMSARLLVLHAIESPRSKGRSQSRSSGCSRLCWRGFY